MISVSFKFGVTSFSALWTNVQTHSEQNLVAAEILMRSFNNKVCVDGNSSSEDSVLWKFRCEKKSNLLNSWVALFLIIFPESSDAKYI